MSDQREILDQLDKAVRLLTLLVTKDMQQQDQIATLSLVGFQPKDIASLIGTTPHTVSVTLSEMKKKEKTSPRADQKKDAQK